MLIIFKRNHEYTFISHIIPHPPPPTPTPPPNWNGGWNHSPWKIRTYLSHMIHMTVTDNMVVQRARQILCHMFSKLKVGLVPCSRCTAYHIRGLWQNDFICHKIWFHFSINTYIWRFLKLSDTLSTCLVHEEIPDFLNFEKSRADEKQPTKEHFQSKFHGLNKCS